MIKKKEVQQTKFTRFTKVDGEKRIVYGMVYIPGVIDTQGDMILAEDLELMAHRYLEIHGLEKTIDTQHDNKSNGSQPIESFIAREGDPDYVAGSWVVGLKINDDSIWEGIKSGELNGFSVQFMSYKIPVVAQIDFNRDNFGETEESMGHVHIFFAEINDDGNVVAGRTSTEHGPQTGDHGHTIKRATATEQNAGHSHRYFLP